MTSASNERQIRARNEQAKRDRLTDEIIVKSLMAHSDGRRWVWLRLSEAQLFTSDETLDPMRMAFDKGRKQFALQLLRDVNRFAPKEYITMTEEATSVALRQEPTKEEDDVGSTDEY